MGITPAPLPIPSQTSAPAAPQAGTCFSPCSSSRHPEPKLWPQHTCTSHSSTSPVMTHSSGTGPCTSKPHRHLPHPQTPLLEEHLAPQSQLAHFGEGHCTPAACPAALGAEPGGGDLGSRHGWELAACMLAGWMCSVAQPHLPEPTPHHGRHLVTAPAGAAAFFFPGKVFYFGKNVFIRPILSAYILQSQGRRRAVQELAFLQRQQLCSLADPSSAGTRTAQLIAHQDTA